MVTYFKYLGWVLRAVDDNWPAVVGNLRKARKSWAWLTRSLGWEGANRRVSGMFFNEVVRVVLIFGSETWVLTPRMGRALGSFQQGVARWISERQPKMRKEGGWKYLPLAAAMEEVEFKEIGAYILKR